MSELRTSTARKAINANTALTASKSKVVQQAKLMDSQGTAWYAVKYGNLEMITKLFPSQCNVYARGPVGENVFHIAMLLNTPSTLAIAKYLVKLYGKTLVNTPYQERKFETDPPGQYEGETALHISVVNHDFDMVKFLIQNGADPRARAYGPFFQADSALYYGEFPLSFAACTGQKDIVSFLKRHGARVNLDKDSNGNTALHMCVLHDQMEMYDHLLECCGASELVENSHSQTPLMLAAARGKLEMFQHIISRRRRIAWAYGPVTSYSLSLRELDSVTTIHARKGASVSSAVNNGICIDEALPRPGAISTIVRKGHLDLLAEPLMQTLLNSKWQRFGKTSFLIHASIYLVLVVAQTFLAWLHSSRTLFNSPARSALEYVSLLLLAVVFTIELVDLVTWVQSVFARFRLLQSDQYQYCPPLYVIPGEKSPAIERKASQNFLSRFMSQPSRALGEKVEE
eukprot:CAMPEP_0175043104 /NCGR_PEP_ID=MMETSP0052_2-20121109/2973_1 /TAXON_ID=51329 ORGANISM="Polytomella parva, Strain SAG 63-3" /NCGR_SAMPLE_ID=MMETSP0052_2 /ASSEMBLY_ACC=CAM_ASM_000194 /LENGTH=456 /DNA_ID=CAMNT_0016306069 /DNA_START=224 /DNA_END=1591 /DNA_ORIENTATION=-